MASTFERAERLSKEDREYYTKCGREYKPMLKPTGETIWERYETGAVCRVVMKGSWTPYDVMRDCGDHYIIARYSRYDRISKDLTEITYDVDDE